MLLAIAVYTFLRLLEDHEAPPFKNLRQMEIEFCSSLLRERVWSNKCHPNLKPHSSCYLTLVAHLYSHTSLTGLNVIRLLLVISHNFWCDLHLAA